MKKKGTHAFWDLIAEEAYLPHDRILKKGTWKQFLKKEKRKNLYLFGCNEACACFIHKYGRALHIAGILDNSRARQGTKFESFPVLSPDETVPSLSVQTDVIVIAMRLNSDMAAGQLNKLGFRNYYGLGVLVSGMWPYVFQVKYSEYLKGKCPVKDIIMMESTNDFDGNAGALYEYLKEKGSCHRFVWILKKDKNKNLLKDSGDLALCPGENTKDLRKYIYYRAVSRWQIWDNHPVRKVRKDQINVFLQHFGMGYKQIAKIFNSPEYVDYVLTTNENVYEIEKDALLYGENTKIIFGELPRNDVLFSGKWRELEKITSHAYDRVVMWAPTLRNSAMYNRVDSDREYPFGISVIYTEKEMETLNHFLREHNMLLLIKIHPRQKCDYTDHAYSNIHYLDGESVKKVHAYKLLTQMDAMISDYSSIVFDYMLLDRPIAWALEDMKHYQIEFLMENPLDFMPGEKIYTLDDLLVFLTHVKSGADPYRRERNLLSRKYNAPPEGRGSEKLARFLGL